MNSVHLVPASSVWPFLEFLQDIGAPSSRFMACAGIPEYAFESQECLLPLHSLTRFAEFASRAEGFHLGLEVGRRTSLHRFGDYGLAILSSGTVKEALVTSERYCRLYNPGLLLMVLAEGNDVILRHRYPREFGEGYLQLEAYTLMIQLNQAQQWFGSNWLPPALHVDPRLAHEIRRFENLAGCQIVETDGPTEWHFSKNLLARPLPKIDRTGDRQKALAKLHNQAPPAKFEPGIRQLVKSLLPTGAPTVAQLARLLGTSMRTLQRRLANQGTFLTAIIDDARRERALELITHFKTSVVEAAVSCGYADPANFTRAFRRWTGMSPREFRRRLNVG